MKIAQLTTHLNSGGIPSYILTLSNALNQQGVDSIVISSGGSLEPQFAAQGIPCFSFPIRTKFEFHPKLLFLLPAIIQKLKDEKVDLIHAHTRVAQVLAAIIFRRAGIPWVSTCHGYYEPRIGRRMFPAWGKKVIAISDGVRNDLIERHLIAPRVIQTVHNGVEIEKIQSEVNAVNRNVARAKWGFEPDDFVACTVARLVEEKGIADFIDALLLLMPRRENLKALIVGEGREKEALMQKVKDTPLESRFVFTGRLDHVASALAVSDVFVHPARWVEAFGLSIIEAMTAGLPVMMTRHWALFDLLQGQGCCIFVDKGNIAQIRDGIESWVMNPAGVQTMGAASKTAVKTFFDHQLMTEKIANIYRAVLREPK